MTKGILKRGLLFIFVFTYYAQVFGQVKATFDPSTGNLTINPELNKWIPGEVLSVFVVEYDKSKFPYKIEYSSSEKFNNKGFGLLSELEKTDEKSLTASGATSILYSQHIIDNKDISHITIIILGADGKEKDKRVFSFPVRHGLKFDISTGAFLHNIVDEVYVLAPDSNGRRIIQENNGAFSVGTGLLLHLHSRMGHSLNVGISMGFEIDNEAKVGYLLGVSALVGHEQKFVFTIGAIARKKYVISEAYRNVDIVDNSIIEIPRVNVWVGGMFFAGTYNF